MRILFAAAGAYGHLYPIIPVARAAQQAGHSVTVATHPQFHVEVERAGLAAVAAGPFVEGTIGEVVAGLTQPPENELDIVIKAFELMVPRTMADLEPILADGGYDLVIHEAGIPGAALAAAAAGIPSVLMGVGRVPDDPAWDVMFQNHARIAAENGWKISDARTMDSPYLDFCPPSLQAPGFPKPGTDHILMRPTAWNSPGALPRMALERDPDKPLVYLTLGTGGVFAQPTLFLSMIEAVAELPVQAIVSTGPSLAADALGEVPDNIEIVGWVPQAELLSRVDLAVHHGGSGTTFAAMARGLPQLLLPQGADQFTNAQILTTAGAGRQILPGEVTPARIVEELRRLLDDGQAREAARALQNEIAQMPSIENAIEQIIKLTQP